MKINPAPGPMKFVCHVEGCGKVYSRQQHLDDHLNTHSNTRPYTCDMCDKAYMRNSHLDTHRKKHFPPELQCGRCGYMCHTRDRLSKHVQTCVEHQCATCGKKYIRKAWFDAHVQKHRTRAARPRKQHICEHCRFPFSKKSNLDVHLRSVHQQSRPFECRCGRKYAHASSLDRHAAKCTKNV